MANMPISVTDISVKSYCHGCILKHWPEELKQGIGINYTGELCWRNSVTRNTYSFIDNMLHRESTWKIVIDQ